jgi:hypothetical protein
MVNFDPTVYEKGYHAAEEYLDAHNKLLVLDTKKCMSNRWLICDVEAFKHSHHWLIQITYLPSWKKTGSNEDTCISIKMEESSEEAKIVCNSIWDLCKDWLGIKTNNYVICLIDLLFIIITIMFYV